MKVLLSHGYFLHDHKDDLKIMKPYPLLGILYLSAYLKKNNLEHHVFDTTFSSKEELLAYVLNEKPDIIGFYVNLLTKPNILDIIVNIRSHEDLSKTVIVLGGPDVTYNTEGYLSFGADFLVIGEGEISFYELVKAIEGDTDFSEVHGIAYKNGNGEIVRTLAPHRIDYFDKLNWPNREAVDFKIYLEAWKNHHGYTSLNVSTQRGCPYSCKWCSQGVFGHRLIKRPVKDVIDEVEFLYKTYQVQSIRFVEDLFTLDQEWIKAFCEALSERKISISFECTTRAETLNEAMILMLKEAGCREIWIAAESGSQQVVDNMNTKVEIKKIITTLQLIKKIGIKTGTFIIIGYPGETLGDIFKTMQFLREAAPDYTAFSLAYPIKGTDFYTEVESDIEKSSPWPLSTDIDIRFKQIYSRKFYKYALAWLRNETISKSKMMAGLHRFYFRLKSMAAFILMNLEALRPSNLN